MFSNIHLVEQSNFVTDVILAAVLLVLNIKIRSFENADFFLKTWRQYFGFMAIVTLIGGFGHLLGYYSGIWLKVVSWILALITLYFLEKNMLKLLVLPRFIHFIPPIKCAISIFLTLKFQNFTPTKTSLTLGMVFIVCPILFYQYFKTDKKAYLFIIGCILMNGFGGIAHAKNIQLADWCNGGDIAHIISTICFIGMYFGLKNIALFEKNA